MAADRPTTASLNSVDIDAVAGLAAKIEGQPEVASATFRANVAWTGGFTSQATIRDYPPVRSDEPASLGGSGTAANPVELVLGALGNCLAVGYSLQATSMGIEITDLRIDLEGDLDLRTFLGLDPDGNAGYEAIRVSVALDADATPEQVTRLHEQVVGTSPVTHTLKRPVPVSVRLA